MGINWLGILQPQDASLPSQPGGCAQCHPGLGSKPNSPPTKEDLVNVDCLICHAPDYKRTVVKDENGKAHLVPAEGVDVVAAAQNAQSPTSKMCSRCHLKAAGGPNFKHGDYPTPETDVHMAAGIECVDCHTTESHKIAGGGYMIAQEVPDIAITCQNCHTDDVHEGEEAYWLNEHTSRVACQTCHIPRIAKDSALPTQMTRDYNQPVYNSLTGLYGPKLEKAGNVTPTYLWWANHLMETPPVPVGSIGDPGALITPWKPLEVTVPFDTVTHTPIYIKQGAYKITGDLDAAVNAGIDASGQDYSGSWEPVTELMYFDVNHQVAPASEALGCADCHTPDGVLDFVGLGYPADRAEALRTLVVTEPPPGKDDSNVFFMSLEQGLNMISLPLEPITPHTARSFAGEIGATVVIRYDAVLGKFVGFAPGASGDGFTIEGGQGYIVNVPDGGTIAFTGAAWTNEPPVVAAAPSAQTGSAWAFMVSGSVLDGDAMSTSDGDYTAVVKNLRTGEMYTEAVGTSGYFAAAWADLNRRAVIGAGDRVEVAVVDSNGSIVSGPFVHNVTLDAIRDAVVSVRLKLGDIIPAKSALLQNYPNPFNPETWIPYHLSDANAIVVKIYGNSGKLIRTLNLGFRDAGIYVSRSKAAYWDGKNESGEEVASGVYFYTMQVDGFSTTRKMIIAK